MVLFARYSGGRTKFILLLKVSQFVNVLSHSLLKTTTIVKKHVHNPEGNAFPSNPFHTRMVRFLDCRIFYSLLLSVLTNLNLFAHNFG